ncbi:MAG TPA: YcnI family protein [Nocardioides sp.]|nr:YcnI family protein [Nocardioides sp.]
MSTRTLARLCVLTAATAAIALSLVSPAGAHVTATPSSAAAGASTVVTFSVGHGCEESPTTSIEIQVPESVLSVTATRNPFWDVESTIVELDEPVTDAHGNTVTERTASVVYTATTPLPDGQRDTFQLSFTVPDAAGEVLAFPTIQTCEKGETAWTEVAAAGQDSHELESPAPSFEILPASAEDAHGEEASEEADAESAEDSAASAGDASDDSAEAAAAVDDGDDGDGSAALGWAGLVAGLLGLAAGGIALARTRTTS